MVSYDNENQTVIPPFPGCFNMKDGSPERVQLSNVSLENGQKFLTLIPYPQCNL